jgi:hypothetical protein
MMKRVLVLFALLVGCLAAPVPGIAQEQEQPATGAPPRTRFDTPEAAAAALRRALSRNDTQALLDLFGRDHADLVLGTDPAAGRATRRRAARLAAQRLTLRKQPDGDITLVLGKSGWPLPIPLAQQDGGWVFDTNAGAGEILARRIGEDELAAIAALRAFVRAQRDYAARLKAAGRPVHYARYVQSTPGMTDGLWWDAATATAAKAGPSPLARFAASQRDFLEGRRPGDPFRGYYFRVLTAQGPNAPGGARSYLVNGRMVGGFAMIAWPVVYRSTGVMTFIVDRSGRVLQKDLGEDTAALVQTLAVFDPGEGWVPARP